MQTETCTGHYVLKMKTQVMTKLLQQFMVNMTTQTQTQPAALPHAHQTFPNNEQAHMGYMPGHGKETTSTCSLFTVPLSTQKCARHQNHLCVM